MREYVYTNIAGECAVQNWKTEIHVAFINMVPGPSADGEHVDTHNIYVHVHVSNFMLYMFIYLYVQLYLCM